MEQRLSVVTLGVADVAAARRFYEEGLGWKASTSGNEQVVFFQAGGMVLALYGRSALAEDTHLPAEGSGFGGIALAYNARSKEEVDTVLAQAVAAGASLLKPARSVFWGGYSGYVADPDGHPWEIAFNPFWEITDDGSVRLPK
ncbi:MAG TPA: VOC family protein [Azospirillaceae bacterium]|nr:VOC family protein [Azospirillaceae bacterium]